MPVKGEFFQNPGSSAAGSFYDYQIPFGCKIPRSPSVRTGTNGGGFGWSGQVYPNTSSCTRWTFSTWLKKLLVTDEIGPIDGGNFTQMFVSNIANNQGANLTFAYGSGATNQDVIGFDGSSSVRGLEKFTDRNNWWHLCMIFDTTQGTQSDRVKVYRNGVLLDINIGSVYSQNANIEFGVGQAYGSHYYGLFYGAHNHSEGNSLGCQLVVAETIIRHSITGDSIANYGYLKNGVWVARDPTDSSYINSTFGSEGLWFKYADSSNLGLDSSGNSNSATTTPNINADHQVIDTPTNDGS